MGCRSWVLIGLVFFAVDARAQEVVQLSGWDARGSYTRFRRADGRPLIHVNTWNHMFGERSTNPKLKKVRVAEYPVYQGTREQVEAIFARVFRGEGRKKKKRRGNRFAFR